MQRRQAMMPERQQGLPQQTTDADGRRGTVRQARGTIVKGGDMPRRTGVMQRAPTQIMPRGTVSPHARRAAARWY
jgi:hypothetical protein